MLHYFVIYFISTKKNTCCYTHKFLPAPTFPTAQRPTRKWRRGTIHVYTCLLLRRGTESEAHAHILAHWKPHQCSVLYVARFYASCCCSATAAAADSRPTVSHSKAYQRGTRTRLFPTNRARIYTDTAFTFGSATAFQVFAVHCTPRDPVCRFRPSTVAQAVVRTFSACSRCLQYDPYVRSHVMYFRLRARKQRLSAY